MRNKQKIKKLLERQDSYYAAVIKSLQEKIMRVAGLSAAALPVINDVLWMNNPEIMYNDELSEGALHWSSMSGFFEDLAERIEFASIECIDNK